MTDWVGQLPPIREASLQKFCRIFVPKFLLKMGSGASKRAGAAAGAGAWGVRMNV